MLTSKHAKNRWDFEDGKWLRFWLMIGFFICFCFSQSESFVESGGHSQNVERSNKGVDKVELAGARKLLDLPDSSPPTCVAKCGTCTPCKTKLVRARRREPTPPGASGYYPQVWICKCGHKSYPP